MSQDTRRRPRRASGLDDLDQRIIALLQQDARQAVRAIAQQLDLPEATVRYRMRRLLQQGILDIKAVVNPHAHGKSVTALIRLVVEPDQVQAAAQQLKALPEVKWLGITTGDHNVALRAMLADWSALTTFLSEHVLAAPGVRHCDTQLAQPVHDASQ